MPNLTDVEKIEDLLRTGTPGIRVGDVEPNPPENDLDISRRTIDRYRQQQESIIVSRLSRFYTVPLALTATTTQLLLSDVATRYSAYATYLALNPRQTRQELPAAVALWKSEADELLNQIVPIGKSQPEDGRDIILDGETLRAGGGTVGVAAISFTTKLPYGGTDQ